MSQTQTGGDPTTQSFEKEVTVVGYADEFNYSSIREWAGKVSGLDHTETDLTEDEYYKLTIRVGDEEVTKQFREWQVDEEEVEEFKNATADVPGEFVDFEHVHIEEETHTHSENGMAEVAMKEVVEQLPDEISGGMEKNEKWLNRYEDDDSSNKVRFRRVGFDKRRILAKETNRDNDDLYESVSKVPSLQIRIKMNANSEELIEQWTNEVISEFHKELAALPGVGKVRYMSCTTKKEQEGECYNI